MKAVLPKLRGLHCHFLAIDACWNNKLNPAFPFYDEGMKCLSINNLNRLEIVKHKSECVSLHRLQIPQFISNEIINI